MDKEQCKIYLKLSDKELEVIKREGLVKHREIATEWATTDCEVECYDGFFSSWRHKNSPYFGSSLKYRIKRPLSEVDFLQGELSKLDKDVVDVRDE